MRRRGAFLSLCVSKAPCVALAAALTLALSAAPVLATPTPQTSINDIEDEVMCPICGTLLQLAESPQAQRERVLVKRLIAEGKNKAEVKDALVAQYGSDVLALPEGSGFNLSAYVVPVAAFVLAAIVLGLGVRRWRRAAGGRAGPPPTTADGPGKEDAERLEADLARYDL